ncbi:hypothetical protein [Microseira wollei]|uniref:hypothetical protein n=1 Tax=Microseira wollei TaxID=467598 RepID=UPI001CFDCE7B|nr:hypothetical protein [Microseira wollei]
MRTLSGCFSPNFWVGNKKPQLSLAGVMNIRVHLPNPSSPECYNHPDTFAKFPYRVFW